MRGHRVFFFTLLGFLSLGAAYGLKRFTLGIDFTDEGAYLAWPLRTVFGEEPFSVELLTLLRPVEIFLALPFKLYPEMTLYQFRLLGWSIHLVCFGLLALFLFQLTRAPVLSALIASIPLFVCHIFGLAAPSYNSLSSDFLVAALSCRGIAGYQSGRGPWLCHLAGGCALFLSTLSHPALGVIAMAWLAREALSGELIANIARRRISASNGGVVLFAGCWLALLLYLYVSGALRTWFERFAVVRSLSSKSLPDDPLSFATSLAAFPFVHSGIALTISTAAAIALGALWFLSRRQAVGRAGDVAHGLALLLVAGLVATFRAEPHDLTSVLVLSSLVLIAAAAIAPLAWNALPGDPEIRFLMLMSGLGAVLYAMFTFYFSPHRSWVSGCLALPFAFATGLALLIRMPAARAQLWRVLLPGALVIALGCVARHHYRNIQRDAPPPLLEANFNLPKLRPIKSTPERVRAVEELHAYLQPKLARGQPLLVYDDCPMLYYLLEGRPVYGLAWAVRYTQSVATLRQLDAELRAKPLPGYAVRLLIDPSAVEWSRAPRINYTHYPLHETVLANYEVEKTIFPFEIWRRRNFDAKVPAPGRRLPTP